ncbi:hypothetical protein [Paracoccus everestensis]|uniref:hypothetical protein n=1 Tax=Paracoccus everestensis TaxID=2903900 RepID=UPI001F41A1BC|nr:hypothetical protein [Paracoccus everestensis]
MLKFILCATLAASLPMAARAADFELIEWRGKTVLQMTGQIDTGTTDKFVAVADKTEPAAHGLPILLLDSPGGSVLEALKLSTALDDRPFHTVIPDGAACASACASIVFIAGRYRTMEAFGRFGQHSCSYGGVEDADCNEIISQHAFRHGVSHGSVAAFLTYVPAADILWFSREDIDGWGISHYPGSEDSGFEKSEPRAIGMITGNIPEGQSSWRLDFWGNGWRAFVRPARDDERELQISMYCREKMPGRLFLLAELTGPEEVISSAIASASLKTDTFTIEQVKPNVSQIDPLVTGLTIEIPKAHVIPWLTNVQNFELSFAVVPPYDPIWATGSLAGSRKNLIFAANHCDI